MHLFELTERLAAAEIERNEKNSCSHIEKIKKKNSGKAFGYFNSFGAEVEQI